jgi:putative ABC transport system permease protein
MHFHDLAASSLKNLRRNRLRTALSLLGIVIGVFSVTLIISLGLGVKSAILGYVEGTVGKDFIQLNPSIPGASAGNSMVALMMGTGPVSLDYDDVQAIADPKNVPYATVVNGAVSGQGFLRYGSQEYRATLAGVSAVYPLVLPIIKVGSGRFFTEGEDASLAPVIVIGPKVAEKLFGAEDPIGKKVKLKDLSLDVVGVLESAGSVAGFDIDTMVMMPLRTMQKRFLGSDKVIEMHVRAIDEAHVEQTVFDITRTLRKRHHITDPTKDDFTISTAVEITDRIQTITTAITDFLAFLAAISLLVGGIGIMNIMLVTVTERIREVGLRKAVGAKDSDVFVQFLAESVALTTAGGFIGGVLGFLVTVVAVAIIRRSGLDVPYVVSVPAFLGAAAVAAVIGIVFGLYPARKAASQDPITALRFE